jgi:hypothetical protein
MLDIILGHCAWHFMVARSALSLFDKFCDFIRHGVPEVRPLPPEVGCELDLAASVLPLLSFDPTASWSTTVSCYDT